MHVVLPVAWNDRRVIGRDLPSLKAKEKMLQPSFMRFVCHVDEDAKTIFRLKGAIVNHVMTTT